MADGKDDGKTTEKRRHARVPLPEGFRATIKGQDGVEKEVTVKDISDSGAGLRVDGKFENHAFVELHMEGLGTIPGRVTREFVEGIGIEFGSGEEKLSKEMEEELKKFRRTVARNKF